MKRPINFIVNNEIYPFDIIFSLGESNEQLRKKLDSYKLNYGDYFNGEVYKGLCTHFKVDGRVIVRLRDYPVKPDDFSTLAHEIYHATNYVMSYIGGKFSEDSEEAYAYFLGFITKKVFEKIKI